MAFWNRKKRNSADFDRSVLIRGGKRLAYGLTATSDAPKRRVRRLDTPRSLGQVVGGPFGGLQSGFSYSGNNRGDFFRWLRDNVPIISAGVWAWVRLTATPTSTLITGSASERQKAVNILNALDRRILETPYGRGSGLSKLTDAYFLELFTTGRFAGEAVLTEDGRSIDHFRFIDGYKVGWEHTEKGWIPFVVTERVGQNNSSLLPDGEEVERFDPRTFFYGTLGTDITNPAGVEPLAAIPWVTEIQEVMLDDMARSSHNAGTPRMQVKIGRPERFSWEGDSEYVERANQFFEQMVSQFTKLDPDDNIFTWSDVEVTVVGGSGKQWEWRLNRDQVVEDVITGLKLFPWVLGRTHKTTMNWVQSQFDLLMQMVASHQQSGADLIGWLCNLELELQGVKATATHTFSKHPDPFRLERANAEKVEFENVEAKVQRGYITKDEGAKLIGLAKAAVQDSEKA